ncbi:MULTISPECIES: hypothetical protein [Arenibacter]|uniref:hypothetical protein n=1 Tax=Arenibacter TaxID=178469 RepID=UPI001C06D607|nr:MULTISPECIES: hypothetical protein [Arenibacter]MBU2906669.1 hypothetical protein [Arenibacter algicola]MCK0136573.1 hypothetical protein [Arenibacter sp. S6351L]
MKTIKTIMTLSLISTCIACQGQAKQENPSKKEAQNVSKTDTTKQMNLLDEQAKVLGSIFGNLETGEENPFEDITNYLELIEKMEGPEADKQYLREQYKLYDLGTDPKKKEEFKVLFNKKLKEAMDKGMAEQQ